MYIKQLLHSRMFLSVAVSATLTFAFVFAVAYGSSTISTNINTGGTLTVSSLASLNGNASTTILSTTGNFMVNGYATTTGSNGNIATQGTLLVTGLASLNGKASTTLLSVGASNQLMLGAGSITDSSGTISFDNENLTTTGILTFGNASSTGTTVTGVKLNGLTVYGDLTVTGTFTPAITSISDNFAIGGGSNASQTLTGNVSGTDTVMTFGNGDISITTGSFTTANAFLFNTASSSVGGTGSFKALNASTTILSTTGNFMVNGYATTTGSTGDIATRGTLTVTGLSSLNGNASTTILSMTGNFMVNGYATTTGSNGNIDTRGALTVTGLSSLNGNASTTILSMTGNFMVNGYATTTGSTGDIATRGTLTVNGAIAASSTMLLTGGLTTYGSDTIGDAIGDTLTINSGTISVGTRATTTVANLTSNVWSVATSTTEVPVLSVSTVASANGRVGVGTTSPYVSLGVTGTTTATAGMVIGKDGTPVAQLLFGTCTYNPGAAVTASTTKSTQCSGATGVATTDRVFVTPVSLPQHLIFISASSTQADNIQVSVYNPGILSGDITPPSASWYWMAIR